MGKKEKDFDVVEEQEVVLEETPVVYVAPKKEERTITFEQWAGRMGVKTQHMRGLKAFVANPNKPRTFSEWTQAVKGY